MTPQDRLESRSYIAIGGPAHGKIIETHRRAWEVAVYPETPQLWNADAKTDVNETLRVARYEVRNFGPPYILLSTLSDSEARRLIKDYELHDTIPARR